jgi:hypothetical protein
LSTGGATYVLKHGYEFDPAQHEALMEIMCYNMSDEAGQIRSELWDFLTKSIKSDFEEAVFYSPWLKMFFQPQSCMQNSFQM